ncbi:MAG: hypothetical protein KC466_08490 [Myxococcales bacterium]|nr:hypothetical protein [Myxococcales bacterium]
MTRDRARSWAIAAVVIGVAGVSNPPSTKADGSPRWETGGGWGPGTRHARLYDPAKVETVRGEVEEVFRFTPWRGMSTGVRLDLRGEKGRLSVHLGPSWFVEHQNTPIMPGDRIEVVGARTIFDGKPTLIAREIRKGDRVLTLRDEEGRPLWSAWRARPPIRPTPAPASTEGATER